MTAQENKLTGERERESRRTSDWSVPTGRDRGGQGKKEEWERGGTCRDSQREWRIQNK